MADEKQYFFHIIVAEDWVSTDILIKKLTKNFNTVYCDSNLAYRSSWAQKSFLNIDNLKTAYVCHDISELDPLLDKHLKELINGTYQNKNKLIYIIDSVDKRSKLYKRAKDYFVTESISAKDVKTKYFKNLNISDNNLKLMFEKCNKNPSRLYYELLKLNAISKDTQDSNTLVQKIIAEIKDNTELNTFDILNAILAKDLNIVQTLIKKLDTSVYDFGLATLLYNNFRNMYILKAAGSNATEQSTGLTYFQMKCIKDNVKIFSEKSLKNILELIYNIDKGIKSGTISTEYAMDLLLVRCLDA